MKTPRPRRLLAIIVALLIGIVVLPACAAAQKPSGSSTDWRAKQDVWWSAGNLVKGALVAYLQLQDRHPEIQREVEPGWDIASLILILDSHSDASTLKALSELSSYYLGESGGELFHCVVLRKGSTLAPNLRKLLADDRSDCRVTLGKESTHCLSDAEYRSNLQGIIAELGRNQSCTIEK